MTTSIHDREPQSYERLEENNRRSLVSQSRDALEDPFYETVNQYGLKPVLCALQDLIDDGKYTGDSEFNEIPKGQSCLITFTSVLQTIDANKTEIHTS